MISPARLVAAATAAAVVAVSVWVLPAGAEPRDSGEQTSVTGIDVASWQHPGGAPIDWTTVAEESGHEFEIIKATESTDYVNPYFLDDRAGAQDAGLVVGAYHFARPEVPIARSATAQAEYFVDTIGTQRLSRTLPPVLDLETTGDLTPEQLVDWAETWLVRVQELTGRTPMLYSYDSFLRTRIAEVERLAGFPLWVAAYQDTPPAPAGDWDRWRMWQRTSSGAVPGIEGRVDLNVFACGKAALLRFATGEVPARVSDRRVQPGEPVTVRGRVDSSYAGETVTLTKRVDGRWKRVGSEVIGRSGRYAFEVAPRTIRTHVYRVRLDSDSPYARVRSSSKPITVEEPQASVVAAADVVPVGLDVVVTGRTDDHYAGETVVLLDGTPSGFITRSTAEVGPDGAYRFAIPADSIGPHVLRVALSVDEQVIAASDLLTLQVVGP